MISNRVTRVQRSGTTGGRPRGATRQAGYDDQSYPASVISGPFRTLAGPGARASVGGVSTDEETVTCDFCGRQAPASATLTWTVAVENGRQRRFCDTCSRAHLRAMEGKLDSEFW